MLSHINGPTINLPDRTIGYQLEAIANLFPDRFAVISRHQDCRLTWQELLEAADRLASGLRELGVHAGDRVGIWAMNCYEWLVIHMACARAGVTLVSVNPSYRLHEIGFVLRRSCMKAIFLRDRDQRANYEEILAEARSQSGGTGTLEHAVTFGSEAWRQLAQCPPSSPHPSLLDDVTNIQYTSGTTGAPKGVLLTHRNLANNGFVIARNLEYTSQDVICLPVPFSHCFGNVIGTMAALSSGACLVLPNWSFDAGATLAAVEAEHATAIYGVPTMFIAELEHPDFFRFDLTSLRTGVMAGAPCPVEIMRRVVDDMHCSEMAIGYGLTETAPIITMSNIHDDLSRRVSTVGTVVPCTEMKVVSVSSGAIVERGVQGEICARGYMLMKGYDAEPEATARAIDPDGWFHTGDLGVMLADGYFKITGRAKDMLIRGGENIYPREIEEFLFTYPKIAEVYVTGLPDDRLGEIVLAWIKLKSGETSNPEEIREFCRGRIAHFKIPECIRFVDGFPTTLSGKIQKFRIREMEIEAQGRADAARIKTA